MGRLGSPAQFGGVLGALASQGLYPSLVSHRPKRIGGVAPQPRASPEPVPMGRLGSPAQCGGCSGPGRTTGVIQVLASVKRARPGKPGPPATSGAVSLNRRILGAPTGDSKRGVRSGGRSAKPDTAHRIRHEKFPMYLPLRARGIQNPNPLRDQELGGPRENTISWHMPYARRNWCFTPSQCRANSRLRTMVITLNKRLAGIQGSLPPGLDQETFRFRADRPGVGFRVLFEIKFRRPTL